MPGSVKQAGNYLPSFAFPRTPMRPVVYPNPKPCQPIPGSQLSSSRKASTSRRKKSRRSPPSPSIPRILPCRPSPPFRLRLILKMRPPRSLLWLRRQHLNKSIRFLPSNLPLIKHIHKAAPSTNTLLNPGVLQMIGEKNKFLDRNNRFV